MPLRRSTDGDDDADEFTFADAEKAMQEIGQRSSTDDRSDRRSQKQYYKRFQVDLGATPLPELSMLSMLSMICILIFWLHLVLFDFAVRHLLTSLLDKGSLGYGRAGDKKVRIFYLQRLRLMARLEVIAGFKTQPLHARFISFSRRIYISRSCLTR